jgi:hypothetical protein
MVGLENIVAGTKLRGIAGPTAVEIVRVEWIGSDALNVVYRGANGPAEVLLYREAEPRLELVQASRAFSFDGDGEAFRIASEAHRIRLGHLFDPYLAVHSSPIEPLPHQITAVYGEMLPRQPLRFLLADDPGAGKTIMAGLFIKELIIRGDLSCGPAAEVGPGCQVAPARRNSRQADIVAVNLTQRRASSSPTIRWRGRQPATRPTGREP